MPMQIQLLGGRGDTSRRLFRQL